MCDRSSWDWVNLMERLYDMEIRIDTLESELEGLRGERKTQFVAEAIVIQE